jgi:hypothetical protein
MSEEKLVRSIYVYVAYFIALVLGVVGSFILIKALMLNSFAPLLPAKEREVGNNESYICNIDIKKDATDVKRCDGEKRRLEEGWFKRELVTGFSYIMVSILVIVIHVILNKRQLGEIALPENKPLLLEKKEAASVIAEKAITKKVKSKQKNKK